MIEGVKQLQVNCYIDDRGYLAQVLQELDNAFPPIKRIYVCGNFSRGVIRGFHKHRVEWKGFFVPHGAAKFVLVPENTKDIQTYILSPRKPTILVAPPGIWNGWMSLEEDTLLIGISNTNFDRDNLDDERIDPYHFGDVWEVKGR